MLKNRQRKGKIYIYIYIYIVRKQQKKKMDAETEFIFEVAELEDSGDNRYRVSNIGKIEQHFQMFKKQFY